MPPRPRLIDWPLGLLKFDFLNVGATCSFWSTESIQQVSNRAPRIGLSLVVGPTVEELGRS